MIKLPPPPSQPKYSLKVLTDDKYRITILATIFNQTQLAKLIDELRELLPGEPAG